MKAIKKEILKERRGREARAGVKKEVERMVAERKVGMFDELDGTVQNVEGQVVSEEEETPEERSLSLKIREKAQEIKKWLVAKSRLKLELQNARDEFYALPDDDEIKVRRPAMTRERANSATKATATAKGKSHPDQWIVDEDSDEDAGSKARPGRRGFPEKYMRAQRMMVGIPIEGLCVHYFPKTVPGAKLGKSCCSGVSLGEQLLMGTSSLSCAGPACGRAVDARNRRFQRFCGTGGPSER